MSLTGCSKQHRNPSKSPNSAPYFLDHACLLFFFGLHVCVRTSLHLGRGSDIENIFMQACEDAPMKGCLSKCIWKTKKETWGGGGIAVSDSVQNVLDLIVRLFAHECNRVRMFRRTVLYQAGSVEKWRWEHRSTQQHVQPCSRRMGAPKAPELGRVLWSVWIILLLQHCAG